MTARFAKGRIRYLATIAFVIIGVWLMSRIVSAMAAESLISYFKAHWLFILSFGIVVLAVTLAYRENPYKTKNQSKWDHYVTVVVPVYNEDPGLLEACLWSLLNQTRRPQEIYVINDGSTTSDYTDLLTNFQAACLQRGVMPVVIKQANAGKRHAQAQAFTDSWIANVFVTVDSDSMLDPDALRELLKPFADPEVQSVAGVVLASNNQVNLLARITDLLFVTGQLIDRSMMSRLGSVLVNSGGLAAYRAPLVRDNLHSYLHETFFGRTIEFSDDSMLTLYALSRGKTVQQPTAFAFTAMPDKLSHHVRQQVRWMRGSFIRSWWRLKYLPLNSYGFMRQAIGWMQFMTTTVLVALILVASPKLQHSLLPYLIVPPVLLGYAQSLRYFSIKRSDESLRSQFATYLLAPMAVLWVSFVLRPIRIYAMFTCFNGNWGTRKSVEVTLHPTSATAQNKPHSLRTSGKLWLATKYRSSRRVLLAANLQCFDPQAIWEGYYLGTS